MPHPRERVQPARRACALASFFVTLFVTLSARRAAALDRQGSAHGGTVQGQGDDGRAVTGSVFLGIAPYNPTYAARPDNTGLALFRAGAHVDVDLYGRKLSIPIDFNFFTDRLASGAAVLRPTEFDLIIGLSSTWGAGPGGQVEFGARIERDGPADAGTYSQTYADARARYSFSLRAARPDVAARLGDGDVSVAATLGWFLLNPTYAARPDNSGLALFRYALRAQFDTWHRRVGVFVDGTVFSDREERVWVAPTELDLTVGLAGRIGDFELQVAFEHDSPLDRAGLVQQFLYTNVTWSFDAAGLLAARPR